MDDNKIVLTDLQFSEKCLELLEKYRKFLIDFKNQCFCARSVEKEPEFLFLEDHFERLLRRDVTILHVDQQIPDVKQEIIEELDGQENNVDEVVATETTINSKPETPEDLSDDWVNDNSVSEESDEEFVSKKTKGINKKPKTETNGQKKSKRKKYVYFNFVCDWIGCGRKYSKKDDLMAHISSCHTKEKPFECDVCAKSFAIEKFLKNHQKSHGLIAKKVDTEIAQKKDFVCDLNDCGKVFNTTGSLKKHQKTVHSDERPYVCEWPGCSSAYKIKESLINHRAIHSDERQFKCDFVDCVKTFQTKWNYYSHMKTHRSQAQPEKFRKYPCDWPGCQFNGKNKQDLTIHMNRHMNIKPFKCQTIGCEMSYFTSYELKQHKIKVHEVVNESDREFKCHIDGCQKRYAVERDLKRHLRRHDRIYVCSWPECGQRYAAKQLLSDHMDRHMNLKSFHCHFVGCGKSFFSKTNFESHMKKIHKYNCNKNNKK